MQPRKQNAAAPLLNRRDLLHTGALAAGVGAGLLGSSALAQEQAADGQGRAATKGRIKQSLCHWCYRDYWNIEELARVAKGLGCVSIELLAPEHWPVIKEHGLVCAIASSHGFVRGMNNPDHWPACHDSLRTAIDQCAAAGFPNVISFTGMRENIPDDMGLENCVRGFKQIVGHAEDKNVTICLEMLNSRVDSHPMKGHPGYQGDHTEYCVEIIRRVGSPRLKLLFDIYHVQIMDGDVIARIRQHADVIGHVHTAGNPGRGELDDSQELNYPAIMQALVDVGYDGYVGQEFIPTRDPLAGLRQAVSRCDV
ncbi:MAG: TIM barrel protein [Pirellulales bacterium]